MTKTHFKSLCLPRPEVVASMPPLPPDTVVVFSKMLPSGCYPLAEWTGKEWRKIENLLAPVPACDRYVEEQVWVDLEGEVYERRDGKTRHIVACIPDPSRKNQYPTVSVHDHALGRRQSTPCHVLIARAWGGHVPRRGRVVRHLDDVPTNRHPTNIAVGTLSQNVRDSIRNGRKQATDAAAVQGIWRDYTGQYGEVKALAERYGIAPWVVSDIINGRVHCDVTGGGRHPLAGKRRASRRSSSITPTQARAAERLREAGLGIRRIAALTGVGRRSVEAALQGQAHAVRGCGEQSKKDGARLSSQAEIARDAGRSEHQTKRSVRIANVPEGQFAEAVEADA